MNQNAKHILTIVAAFLLSATIHAQSTTSAIAGCISGSDGPLSDVLITVVYQPTRMAYHTFTDSKGHYRINGITAGSPYILKTETMGYHSLTITDLTAPLGGTVVVDLTLTPNAVMLDAVSVIADGSHSNMDVHNAGVGTYISHQTLEAVPTASRTMNDILLLTPQSTTTSNGFAVGGGNYRASSVTVDGASFNNAFGIGSSLPAGGSPLSLDAIDQLTVNITPYDVRQSGFLGGAINVITKQGGNQWHGSLYDYYTNSHLGGNHIGKMPLTSSDAMNNTLGFTLGGPLVKDKLFFFLNAEYTPQSVPGATAQARADSLAEWGGNGYNRPTFSQMEEIRSFLQDRYGYDPGHYQNYTIATPNYKLLARLDWNVNANSHFAIRFSHTHVTANEVSNSMSGLGGANTFFRLNGQTYAFNRYSEGRTSDYAMLFESARYFKDQNFSSLAAELNTSLFDGRGHNTLRATWSYQNEPRRHYGSDFPTVDILEPYTKADSSSGYALFTTFGLDPFTYRTANRVNMLNLTDEVNYTHGVNTLTVGAQLEYNRIENVYMQGGAGWYVYDSWQSFANASDPVLSMITYPTTDNPAFVFDHIQASLYAQDEMELNPYFKLTAGLRLEAPFIRFVKDNYNAEFDAVAKAHPNSSFGGLNTDNCPNAALDMSPRVGFNWDATHDRKLVVRGGTGLFTGRIPNVWLINAISSSGVLQSQYVSNTSTGSPALPFYSSPDSIAAILTSQQMAPTSAVILDKYLRMPTNWKSSLALDAQLPLGIKATLEGIFSLNYNEVVATTLGYQLTDSIQLPGEPEARAAYASEGIKNSNGAEMHGYLLHNALGTHGHYFSLTAQLEKHTRSGLDMMAAYTFSSSLSLTDGSGDAVYSLAQVSTIHGDNSPSLGYSAYVSPHRVIASLGYTLHEGRNTATRIGLLYEGCNVGIVNYIAQSRYSYQMNSVGGITASRLLYIPTQQQLDSMPFVSDQDRQQYEEFISSDRYLNSHRGQYCTRNHLIAPWLNRLNLKVDQQFFFTVGGRTTTLEVGADLNNVGNLLNSQWGVYQKLKTLNILQYSDDGQYSFTAPEWSPYNNLTSVWQLLLHVRYSF